MRFSPASCRTMFSVCSISIDLHRLSYGDHNRCPKEDRSDDGIGRYLGMITLAAHQFRRARCTQAYCLISCASEATSCATSRSLARGAPWPHALRTVSCLNDSTKVSARTQACEPARFMHSADVATLVSSGGAALMSV